MAHHARVKPATTRASVLRARAVCALVTFALSPLASAQSAPPAPSASGASASPSPTPTVPREHAAGQYISGACPNGVRCIAFTFDDGPEAPLTSQLLDILDQHHLHVTFFVVGNRLDGDDPATRANRAVLRDARRRGHFIGNHTYHHWVLNRLNETQLAFELDRTSDVIADVLGERPGFFRAPYGMLGTIRAIRAVAARDYTTVRWVLDPRDWAEHTAEAVLRNFRYQLYIHPQGGVLLMHDVHAHTIAAFPLILDEIERRNRVLVARHEQPFRIVTLEDLYHPRSRRRHTHAAP